MAINEYYIDAGGGSDSSGDGSSGNPWATLYYAFANSTHGTSGVRFWLHGTDLITSVLPTDASGSSNIPRSSTKKPIRLQGWDKLATGERYPGIIKATVPLTGESLMGSDSSRQINMEMHNIELIDTRAVFGRNGLVANCYLHSTAATKYAGCGLPWTSVIVNCEVSPSGINSYVSSGLVSGCLFTDSNLILPAGSGGEDDGSGTSGAVLTAQSANVTRNIFVMTGNYTAIDVGSGQVSHNSVLCPSGTASHQAIRINGRYKNLSILNSVSCTNNIVEGYGGMKAFYLANGSVTRIVAGNAAYNNGTDFDLTATLSPSYLPAPTTIAIESDNESLSGSPFAKSGALTFDNRFTYFAPNNVGNVLGGAYNGQGALDKGAVQTPATTTGSGSDMLTNPGMAGGMRG